jgi:uncharacterized caspase-like protein
MHIGFGRKILFVDTCRSANAYGARVINDSAQNQVVVYTATRQQQDALELPKLKHGVFTYATLEGLSGKADRRGQKAIRVQEFGQYVKDRVLELTNGDQEPDYYKPLSTDDFVLARLP